MEAAGAGLKKLLKLGLINIRRKNGKLITYGLSDAGVILSYFTQRWYRIQNKTAMKKKGL